MVVFEYAVAMTLQHLNPAGLPDWSSLFSQVVVADSGSVRIAVVSGQVGVDAGQKIAGDGSLQAQFDRACQNLDTALRAADLGMRDVAKLTIYVVGYSRDDDAMIAGTLSPYFAQGSRPALTLVGVQALARPEFRIEIEALAIRVSSSQ